MNLACSTSNTRLTHWRFLSVVLPEYLVWIYVSIGVCIWVANPHIKAESRPLPLPAISSPSSRAVLALLFNSSPVMSCKTGSTSSSSASRFLSSLWRWMTNPPRLYSVIYLENVSANTNKGCIRNFPVVPEFHSISKLTLV